MAFSDADTRFVRGEFISLEKLHRVRGRHRQLEFGGQLQRLLQAILDRRGRGKFRQALHFKVIAMRQQLCPGARVVLRLLRIAGSQCHADITMVRARQGYQALTGALGKPLALDLGTTAVLVDAIGLGHQFTQIAVTGARLAQQQQAVRLVTIGFIFDPDIATDDRLDALAARSTVKLYHAEDVGQIGQRQRRHAVRFRRGNRVINPRDPVGDRVFAVQAEMDKRRRRHADHFNCSAAA